MRRIFAALALAALALVGITVPAYATGGATEGSWSTTQTISGGHSFTYDYTVSPKNSTQQYFTLTKACYTGPGTSASWNPQLSRTVNAFTTPLDSGSGWGGMAGNGVGHPIASSLSSGTTCLTSGSPAWGVVTVAKGNSTQQAPLIKTWFGSSGSNNVASSNIFDLSTNTVPTPVDLTESGLSMDFSCTSSFNTAYSSHWTWYYNISGTSPNWVATTTGLVRNSETGVPVSVDLGLGSNPHIVNPSTASFTWASGAAPTVNFAVIWGSDTYCEDPTPLNGNF